ncbi:O131 family O-antigen flippase [Escherichia coli]|uniref:O131 family O-antigen flippase n=1 Tax=Escherichia coli TaxID=562 RepID=UPI0009ABD1A2|nr:O131 family O-antigen flippase [Escherichia coli]ARA19691.1 polysaccharide biosynthesis protein [Escherichia coli]ARW92267.1 polysaccharide biosynthesis protein [Escherichia coli]ARX56058.1 polysaccharide biosynthesis protein [Escherichia coli]EFC1894825.1 O131 family O-antigen flippase [Escherichia coli]EFI9334401.1 O131 family O-antigen flippase [Escherichia coli]
MSVYKNSSIYLISNIFNALIPFILLPILTRNLTPYEYGQIAMFQTLVSGLASLTGLNTVGAANRRYYDITSKSGLAVYNTNCFYILILSCAALLLLSLLLSDLLSSLLTIPNNWIYLSVVISGATFIIQFRLGQWQIREKAFWFGILQISQSVIVSVLTIIFLICMHQGASSRVNSLFMVSIVYALVSLYSLYKSKLIILTKINLLDVRDALYFGVPLIPHILGIFCLSALDRVLINGVLGASEAGIYMLAAQLSLGMMVFFDALNKALVPWLFNTLSLNDVNKINSLIRFTYLFFIIVAILGGLSFWIGPLVVELVAGNEYLNAKNIIGWLCLGQAFNGMYLMVTNYLFYAKCTGRLSIVTIFSGGVNIVLLLVLMKFLGITGVAISFSISMFIRFLATWWLAAKVCGFSWRMSIRRIIFG